jgi:hypothetical protein
MADVDRTRDAKERLKIAKQNAKQQNGTSKGRRPAIQVLNTLAKDQGEAEEAPNHAAMKPIVNWISFATNRDSWKAIVKKIVEEKYR